MWWSCLSRSFQPGKLKIIKKRKTQTRRIETTQSGYKAGSGHREASESQRREKESSRGLDVIQQCPWAQQPDPWEVLLGGGGYQHEHLGVIKASQGIRRTSHKTPKMIPGWSHKNDKDCTVLTEPPASSAKRKTSQTLAFLWITRKVLCHSTNHRVFVYWGT